MPYAAYHEPSIYVLILVSAFLFLLNLVNHVLDRVVYCGLVGQIGVGVAFIQIPEWFGEASQTIGSLGYIGLILIIYHGGLSTSLSALRANIFLSASVALTGIAFPIGLSFVLQRLVNATAVQAFAAGAALCSTSLGTTFTVLGTSGLANTRLGIVLTSAAMIDDVVGLVMVQVISNLGGAFDALTIMRPIIVSVGLVVVLLSMCHFLIQPGVRKAMTWSESRPGWKQSMVEFKKSGKVLLHFLLLFGLVTASTYAGSSNLFAAYLSGVVVTWLDTVTEDTTTTGLILYHEYYEALVQRILKPFFFASIGFSIPISEMFSGAVIWRGLVYTVLMMVGKLACGLWLLPGPSGGKAKAKGLLLMTKTGLFKKTLREVGPEGKNGGQAEGVRRKPLQGGHDILSEEGHELAAVVKPSPARNEADKAVTPSNEDWDIDTGPTQPSKANDKDESDDQDQCKDQKRDNDQSGSNISSNTPAAATTIPNTTPPPPPPRSLYPASLLASAMVSRGEIGFLISSIAESKGIFSPPSAASTKTTSNQTSSSASSSASASGEVEARASELYLIVTWAIVLCTVIGPLSVGLLVRRVRRLRGEVRHGEGEERGQDPLGGWGVGL